MNLSTQSGTGTKYITKHVQRIENVDPDNIVAAYCTIIFDDDRQFTDIMTWAEIQKAWSKSKMNPDKEGSTHKEFAQEMAGKPSSTGPASGI
jgi:recombination protein RecT